MFDILRIYLDSFFTGSRLLEWIRKWFLIFILAGLYIPLLCFILLSFNTPSVKGTVATVMGNWNGFSNYIDFFSRLDENKRVLKALFNSLLIALISLPISLAIGLITTIHLWTRYGRGKRLVFIYCNSTISCPDIIQAISFSLLFSALFIPLGFFSVICTHIALQIPYVIMFLYPKLSKLNINLLLASNDLNFHIYESIFNVIIPSLLPNIAGAALVAFAISFDDYVITNLVRGNLTTFATEMYGMKTGIKLWSSVMGSIMMMFIISASVVSCIWRCRKSK